MKKIILLNAGSQTRKAFKSGLTDLPTEHYKSKEILLHINKENNVAFIHDGVSIDFADSYVFTRLRATDSHFCGILYEYLQKCGIGASDPINRSFRMSKEKTSQMSRFAMSQIPVPETIIAREESYAKNRDYVLSHIHFPIVYKTDGSQGRNVHKVDSLEELEQRIAQKEPTELFMIQTLIPNTFDTRTLVVYGKILGTIKRTAKKGVFLNNVSQGASVEEYTLTPEEAELAIQAVRVTGVDFGGVDIIHTEAGPYILEVNKSPQIKGFESIYGVHSVFKTIAQMLENGTYEQKDITE